MEIRPGKPEDVNELMRIFERARSFMTDTGNARQWINGYPQRELIEQEIDSGHCYVCLDNDGSITGTFCFVKGPDPTYNIIEEGCWPDDEPYYVIHRLASDGRCSGVAHKCIEWCFARHPHLRADTHEDNKVMQHLLEKHGFMRCGIIYVANGTPRIAYQKNQ